MILTAPVPDGPSGVTYIKAYDYDGAGNVIYLGWAQPGTATSAAGWAIQKLTYNNTGGESVGSPVLINPIILSGDPFTSGATGDFSLISTGAGAACRAAGFPGTFQGIPTTTYLDFGVAQHQDPAGGGGGGSAVWAG